MDFFALENFLFTIQAIAFFVGVILALFVFIYMRNKPELKEKYKRKIEITFLILLVFVLGPAILRTVLFG